MANAATIALRYVLDLTDAEIVNKAQASAKAASDAIAAAKSAA